MKGSANLDNIPAFYLERYASLCGAVLARAHAHTGDPAQIAGYPGKSDRFDRAMVEFAFCCAEQNSEDFKEFQQAVEGGQLQVMLSDK